ncbi:MAG TPA: 23S rRNA (pseudouridine(1915)-N(3))-methyltransferase RlmH [Caulobacteraceae bacterium]|nr:23S rRNA (pseudouridine(1915)-N(3))-methyltransferase RlmH [Caulobacteraceae bacterium]
MRISLICVGKLGQTPEAVLARDYVRRAGATGRALGLAPVEIIEVEARRRGRSAEAEAILAQADEAILIACDERGRTTTSAAFARRLAELRDQGARRLAFAIGGADGLDASALGRAAEQVSFGPQTWPHALARVMLAEQIYRAATILAGSPYHRP